MIIWCIFSSKSTPLKYMDRLKGKSSCYFNILQEYKLNLDLKKQYILINIHNCKNFRLKWCITMIWIGGGQGCTANVHYQQRARSSAHVQQFKFYHCFPRPTYSDPCPRLPSQSAQLGTSSLGHKRHLEVARGLACTSHVPPPRAMRGRTCYSQGP